MCALGRRLLPKAPPRSHRARDGPSSGVQWALPRPGALTMPGAKTGRRLRESGCCPCSCCVSGSGTSVAAGTRHTESGEKASSSDVNAPTSSAGPTLMPTLGESMKSPRSVLSSEPSLIESGR